MDHLKQFNKPVQFLRSPERLRILEVDRVVSLLLSRYSFKSILDVGTGSGIFAEAFLRSSASIIGIDINPSMLSESVQYIPHTPLLAATMESLPFKPNTFDLVFFGQVLHESDEVETALQEAARLSSAYTGILEWIDKQEKMGPPLDHRLKADSLQTLCKISGFPNFEIIILDHLILYLCSK